MTQRSRHPLIIDAHLDLAYNALYYKRKYRQAARKTREVEESQNLLRNGQCTVGLPDLIRGRVGLVFGTIYVEPESHKTGNLPFYTNAQEAHALGMAQLDFYHRWEEHDNHVKLVKSKRDLEDVVDDWKSKKLNRRVGIVLLMEGADPILEPKELERWVERGVRIVGPAWDTTRYAGGTWTKGRLSKLGHELLDVMANLNVVLDVAHLSHESLYEALDVFEGKHVVATHCNAHRYLPTERHLPDRAIEMLAERGAVIGVVPFNRFLKPDWNGKKEEITLDHVIRMIDHICQLTGSAEHVGIGSDFDGGFGAQAIPRELDTIRDLYKIGDELLNRGYDDSHVRMIMHGNWLRKLNDVFA